MSQNPKVCITFPIVSSMIQSSSLNYYSGQENMHSDYTGKPQIPEQKYIGEI